MKQCNFRTNRRTLGDEDLFVPVPATRLATDDNKYTVGIEERLSEMKLYKNFMDVIGRLESNYLFETFQKSAIYEVLFFYISRTALGGVGLLHDFVSALCQNYFAFPSGEISRIVESYTKKHYLFVIPRGHGKSFIQSIIGAAVIATLRRVRVLVVGQNRDMASMTKKFIIDYLMVLTAGDRQVKIRLPTDRIDLLVDDGDGKHLYTNSLKCTSAVIDSSLRGHDPHVCLVDEAMVINNHATILALAQRQNCKVGYYTSPVNRKHSLLLNMVKFFSNCTNINFHRVSYFCFRKDHLEYSQAEQGCINLIFFIPKHIVFTRDNMTITNVMTDARIAYIEEMGIIQRGELDRITSIEPTVGVDPDDRISVFSDRFLTYISTPEAFVDLAKIPADRLGILKNAYARDDDRRANANLLDHLDFFIYVDPAYNATPQSGVGLACTTIPGPTARYRPVVVHMAHRFLKVVEMVVAHTIISEMLVACIERLKDHYRAGRMLLCFYVAIENNAQQCSTAIIHQNIVSLYEVDRTVSVYTYRVPSKPTTKDPQPEVTLGFNLGVTKTTIFATVIDRCNHLNVKFSSRVGVEDEDTNIMEQFIENCATFHYVTQKRTYTGKINKRHADDMIVAVIMSLYLAIKYTDDIHTYKFENKPTYPWIRILKKNRRP